MSANLSNARSRVALAAAAIVAALAFSGCASVGDVAAGPGPNAYSVTAEATGTRLAWAHAHEKAVDAAQQYCGKQGLQAIVRPAGTSGVGSLEQHTATVTFECRARSMA
ncbi:hypothetical protein [Paraburkholderia phosphatilytica]|uniref:hypothetical protein n=1 Tax=Paraburkholderia phosphatilytica TaxID=2282883 RepID=UPI000E515C30|nr:hypothetical protein [Paraburkholderia phosphatilytica]